MVEFINKSIAKNKKNFVCYNIKKNWNLFNMFKNYNIWNMFQNKKNFKSKMLVNF